AWMGGQYGLRSVVLWGPGEEALAAAIVAASEGHALLAPSTSLTDLVAIAQQAAIMISGDTGPTHVAAALGTPVVALFGPTSPERNGPWDPNDGALSRYVTCDCHYRRECRHGEGERWCLGTIGEADVREAVDRRIAISTKVEGRS